jgi:CheY-like chemotaxis protein
VKNHRKFAHVPVVAITASTTQGQKYKHYCMKLGFNGFITKPYVTTELLELLADQLDIKLKYDSNKPSTHTVKPKITAPPEAILNSLLSLVQSGDISNVIKQSAEIALMDSGKYKAFAQKIKQLADDFFLLEIEQFIAKYKKE